MPTPKFTAEFITAAIQGFEFQKTSIDGKIAELRAMLPGGPVTPAATPEPTKRKRRKMSAPTPLTPKFPYSLSQPAQEFIVHAMSIGDCRPFGLQY
jgi:hypothetical protein